MRAPWHERATRPGWVLLPLRAFLALVFLYGGLSKVAGRSFLDASAPLSMHASVIAVRASSPIGALLGPVQAHSFAFGLLLAAAEFAVGTGVALGLFTRVAAGGGMLLSLLLWLTVSWGAQPWFTSADLVYLFAFTPLLISGAGGVLSLDAWLERVRQAYPGTSEDRTRRALLATAAAALGSAVLAGASLLRRSPVSRATRLADTAAPPATLTPVADVAVGTGRQVTDGATGEPVWVLQLQAGHFSAYDARCPHQGCVVAFVSASSGFQCPCHGSRFDAHGRLLTGPAQRGLASIPVEVRGGDVRTV